MTPGFTATSTLVATAGKPFEAAVSSDGTVFVSVTADGSVGSATGVQLFLPTSGTLRSSCVNSLPAALLGSNTAFADLSFFPNGTDLGGGIGFSGAIFYHATDLLGCKATGFVVGQGSISANDAGTIAVAVTPDGAFAFVANESGMAPGAGTNGNIGVGDYSAGQCREFHVWHNTDWTDCHRWKCHCRHDAFAGRLASVCDFRSRREWDGGGRW
jgi:hypothetical protein